MKKLILTNILILLSICLSAEGQYQYKRPIRPTKNVILMIPDGTSTSVLSIARWYQIYNKLGSTQLNIDPYLCGLVKTYSSNSPIPDSAPAMSGYTTGMPARNANIAIYPEADPEQDLLPVDTSMAFQPLVTIMEAAKIEKSKAIGIVVTTDFCHATPAACASHHYNRRNYSALAPQMVHNGLDVVFGGGANALTDNLKDYLKKDGVQYFERDIESFRNYKGTDKVWALFAKSNIPYDIDIVNDEYPTLSEMTQKAIDILSQKENGFFLMVEGSRIDMAAHATDVIGVTTEFLAFDKAVGVAMDFARENGETTVIVLPDHGNSGLSFGSRKFLNYTDRGLDDSFKNISNFKRTAKGLESILLKTKPEEIKTVFKKYTNIDLTDEELKTLLSSKNYEESDYTKVGSTVNMISTIAHIMQAHTFFEFISGSHTGEDVFLAAYHPQGDLPLGHNTNTDINNYLSDVIGLRTKLSDHTKEVFAKHTDVFYGYKYLIDKSSDHPKLIVEKGSKKLEIPAYSSLIYMNGREMKLNSVTVYIDKNDTFYIPQSLIKMIK